MRHFPGRVRAWALDARGHGDSRAAEGTELSWDALGHDVLAAVDQLSLAHPMAIGHSSGGTALLLAEASRPGTFAALYCYEPVFLTAPRPPDLDQNPLAAAARRRRENFASRAEAYQHFSGRGLFAEFSPEALGCYVEHGFEDVPDGGVRLKCRAEDEARMYAAPFPSDFLDRLASVHCPVRVAGGASSTHFGPEVTERLARALPDGSSEVMPGLGHFGPLQDPPSVARSAAAFLLG